MSTSLILTVFRGKDDDPFDGAVIGALMGTEQTLHLGDATFPGTVVGVDLGRSGRSVHLSFELADVTYDPVILSAPSPPPPPSTHRRHWFSRS